MIGVIVVAIIIFFVIASVGNSNDESNAYNSEDAIFYTKNKDEFFKLAKARNSYVPFLYKGRDDNKHKRRQVLVEEVYMSNGHTYVKGYDKSRRDYRSFRYDRIILLELKKKVSPTKQIVYVSKSGKKYHQKGCSQLKSIHDKFSVSEARKKGYKKCKKC